MPTLINDWDSKGGRPTTVWGVTCTRCGKAGIATNNDPKTPATPKGWEEAEAPNADGRTPALCPDCKD